MPSDPYHPEQWSLTPTPLPPAPRKVRSKVSRIIGLWTLRLFTLPHMLAGIVVAAYLVFILLWIVIGADLTGYVTDVKTYTSRKGGVTYSLRYTFTIDGVTQTGSESVPIEVYQRFNSLPQPVELPSKSREITVRHLAIGPMHYSGLPEFKSVWPTVGFLTLWVTIWNGIMSLVFYGVWIEPIRTRALYRTGQVTEGTVVSKRISTGKSTSHYVKYTFDDPTTGEPVTHESLTNRSIWYGVSEGQNVTVIFDPSRPKRNAAYELGDYEIDMDDRTR